MRARGVPKEICRLVQFTTLAKFIEVTSQPHTREEIEKTLQTYIKQRVQLLGKDSVFVDGVFYTKASRRNRENDTLDER